MLVSLILMSIIAMGGMALTYLLANDRPLMWRLAAGSIIGSAGLGLAIFVLGFAFGFNPGVLVAAFLLTAMPLALLYDKSRRGKFLHDWAVAKGKMQGTNAKKILRFCYYAFFALVFWLFFDRAVYEMADGIYTGGSQNLGDLPFHLGAIFGFIESTTFPPENPSWAGAKFSYPFIADLLTAGSVRLGATYTSAMFIQNFVWAFSLLVILEAFVSKVSGSRLAGRIAPALLIFSGGLGFLWFFQDLSASGKSLMEVLWSLPRDYTIGDQFRWGNSMVVLFITQRSLLLGMPLTILVLGFLWNVFSCDKAPVGVKEPTPKKDAKGVSLSVSHYLVSPFLMGTIAGILPLIHVHSLVVLFIVTAFLFAFRPDQWKKWIAFGVGTAVVALPILAWTMTGSATDSTKFFAWHFGWDSRGDDVIWFWIKNTGILLPMIAAGIYLVYTSLTAPIPDPKDKKAKTESIPHPKYLLLFYIPFAALFLISNAAKLAPWEWDNIKILIYWFLGSLPLVALVIARGWQKGGLFRYASIVALLILTFSGALDVWRTMSGHIKTRVFDADAVNIAAQIKNKTERGSIILNAPTYNSPVVLSGRQSLMRYSGHLSSHGIDYLPRENDVKRIYEGGGVSEMLLRKYNISYVLISPEERNTLKANEAFFAKYPVVAESGQYRLYKVN